MSNKKLFWSMQQRIDLNGSMVFNKNLEVPI